MATREGVLGDKKIQQKFKKYEKRLLALRKEQLVHVMSDRLGRAFIYDLVFNRLGLQDVYPGQDSGIYRHEGKRDVALKLGLELQQECTNEYLLMITERMEFVKHDKEFRDGLVKDTGESDEDQDADGT